MANNPVVGAWELVSDSNVGIRIYTGLHYAALSMPKDRKRAASNRATPDEALAALNSCPALAGTYTLSGSRITHTRVANTRAELSGRPNVTDYTIVADTMTGTNVSGARTTGAVNTWNRLPDGGAGSPLVGAWELVDDTRQGVLIYTGTHYAVVQMQKERNLPKGDQYTPEEALEALYTCGVLAGTYTVSGSTLTMERTANTRPESIGVTAVMEFTVEGDVMKARGVSGGVAGEVTWRKVS